MTQQHTEDGLNEAREGIDAVDDEIHALLMKRAELVRYIGSAKRGGGGAYRPAREAHILRRLHANNNSESLDFSIVYRLWREMIGGFTAMQAPLRISVPAESGLDQLARDHFGAAAVIRLHDDNDELLEEMRIDSSLLAVVPIHGWTAALGDDTPNVVAALPVYGDQIDALCLSTSEPQDSGNDLTLFAVAGGIPGEDAMCLDQTETHSLIIVDGFHANDPDACERIARQYDVEAGSVTCIGAFPAPIQETGI